MKYALVTLLTLILILQGNYTYYQQFKLNQYAHYFVDDIPIVVTDKITQNCGKPFFIRIIGCTISQNGIPIRIEINSDKRYNYRFNQAVFHEVAHWWGYESEDDANWIAYVLENYFRF